MNALDVLMGDFGMEDTEEKVESKEDKKEEKVEEKDKDVRRAEEEDKV